jgi:hypothetical protein
MSIVLLTILLLFLIAVLPIWPHSRKWGANFSLYILTMMLVVFVVSIANNV